MINRGSPGAEIADRQLDYCRRVINLGQEKTAKELNMFKRFIFATDLSPASYAVAGCLGGLKAFETEQCLLLFCLSFNDAASEMLGGVAYGVINRSTRPVLVVPIEKARGEENICKPVARIDFGLHILFPTDFSQMDDKAFTYVEQLVAMGVSKVTLVHVQDRTRLEKHLKSRLEEFNAQDRMRLENLPEWLLIGE
jgi:hypothetical protein